MIEAPELTRGCERARQGRDARPGSSARCRKHAPGIFDAETPSTHRAERPSVPPLLGLGDATTYGPSLGARFLTRDPLEAVSRDPYGYAFNDPINTIDPSGMLPSLGDIAGGIGDFLTGGDCGDGFLGAAGGLLGDLGELAWEYKWDIALTAAMFVPGAGAAAWTYRAARIVRAAKATQGMAGGIRATRATSWLAGRMWTGVGSRSTAVGRISSTGLRQFRNPAFKPKLGITQSNFESRAVASGRWPNNFHVEIWP